MAMRNLSPRSGLTSSRDSRPSRSAHSADSKDDVERAVRSAELAATHRAALVLLAETDFVSIALALHRVTRGALAPFVLCDPLLRDTPASARLPANHANGVAALAAAAGGSLCLRSWRLPFDFVATVERARDLACDLQIIIYGEERHLSNPFLILPAPIWVPSLQTRTRELPRIVMEYAIDAIVELGVPETSFTEADRQWVLEHAATMTWAGIQEATRRLVALRASPSLSHAAERLGMPEVWLRRWSRRQKMPLILYDPELR
jgi:hypothetical protein